MGTRSPSYRSRYGGVLLRQVATPTSTSERAATPRFVSSRGSSGAACAVGSRPSTTTFGTRSRYTVLDFDTFEGTYVNLRTRGPRGSRWALEARRSRTSTSSASTRISTARSSRARATSTPSTRRRALLRRPRHQASLSAQLSSPLERRERRSCGVGELADSDSSGLPELKRSQAYTRLDARLRVRVAGLVEAFVMAETPATTAQYQEGSATPRPGRAVRAGWALRSRSQLRRLVGGSPSCCSSPPRRCRRPRRRCGCSLNLTADEAARGDAAARPALPGDSLGRRPRHVGIVAARVAGRGQSPACPGPDLERILALRPDCVVSEYTDATSCAGRGSRAAHRPMSGLDTLREPHRHRGLGERGHAGGAAAPHGALRCRAG